MSNSKVTLHSKLTAVSSKPVSSGKTHTLSDLDSAMAFHTLHIIIYYNNQDNFFVSSDLSHLRESLSKVLTSYPTMTGRLATGVDGNWEVKCNDAGVRVIIATVDTTLHQWLSSASASQEKLLTAWDDMPHDPSTWSPFRIQINSFEGGGVAIGLSCNHMLADFSFLASFFKSWTETHRHLPITYPPSFTPLLNHSLPPYETTTKQPPTSPPKMATTTFKFSSSTIKQCLSKVHQTCPNATPFDFLAALFWSRIALLKPSTNHHQTHSLTLCTDFRSLLKAPLPIGYFGNALHFSTVSQKMENMMDSDQLGDTVSLVHEHLAGLAEEEIWSAIEGGKKLKSPSCMYGNELTCVCMEHLMDEANDESLLYAAKFGNNERPAHVTCQVGNVRGEGLIIVMPSNEGGVARNVLVMLVEEELAELSKDEVVLQLEPTVVLAGCGVVDH
ncbi:hypothetical protein RJT34_19002 [Clitoria ternatea]|uniref:Uncharacterized protein n=1 Tax=Clitoria ternatea TaxID=43366 RepID=A0AAN9IQ80_CLITE